MEESISAWQNTECWTHSPLEPLLFPRVTPHSVRWNMDVILRCLVFPGWLCIKYRCGEFSWESKEEKPKTAQGALTLQRLTCLWILAGNCEAWQTCSLLKYRAAALLLKPGGEEGEQCSQVFLTWEVHVPGGIRSPCSCPRGAWSSWSASLEAVSEPHPSPAPCLSWFCSA